MSQEFDFKLRFDQMLESDPTLPETSEKVGEQELYQLPGSTRNLGLAWPDGKRCFFNYAYLVSVEFDPKGERNTIRVSFSSHKVTLSGYALESLFLALFEHLPRWIVINDPRYATEKEMCVVEGIVEVREG